MWRNDSAARGFHRWTVVGADAASRPLRRRCSGPEVELPAATPLDATLDEALTRRLSCRQFSPEPLAAASLAAALRAAYGVRGATDVEGFAMIERPVPSAGACHPLRLNVVAMRVQGVDPGCYRYADRDPADAADGGALMLRAPAIEADRVVELFLDQPWLADAACLVLISAHPDATLERYWDRGYRYVLYEAAHAAQNLVLAAAALELGALTLGGFQDNVLAEEVGLDDCEWPLYGVALGPAATLDRAAARRVNQAP